VSKEADDDIKLAKETLRDLCGEHHEDNIRFQAATYLLAMTNPHPPGLLQQLTPETPAYSVHDLGHGGSPYVP
jgi:hypothetical protein